MTAPQDPYSSPGEPGSGYPGGPPPRKPGPQIFSILAIVCGVLAILTLPIIFGPVGAILAVVGRSRGETLWKVGLGAAIGGLVLGILLGSLVTASN
jgi:hypothetical protein